MAYVHNQDMKISFGEVGDGPPVVLGHSFLCSRKMWREQVRALSESYRMINLDFRGHGGSGAVTRAFSLYDAVSDVVAVLDELGVEKATWCGLSVGGMVALRAALVCPERVERLILLDTDAGSEPPLQKLRYLGMGLGARFLGLGPFLTTIVRLMFGATTLRENPSLVDEWRTEFSTAHIPSMLRTLDALMQRDSLLSRLQQIAVPSLVIVGAEDRSLPLFLARRIHDLLPDSRYVEVPAAGHLSALEQPGLVNEAILSFFAGRSG